MNEISLIDAWSMWSSGADPSQKFLWGIQILWWGRIGKCVQLLGGLTIIAEIIGPERLRSFGSSLHTALTFEGLKRRFVAAVKLFGDQFVYLVSLGKTEDEALERVFASELAKFYWALIPVLGAIWTYYQWSTSPNPTWLGAIWDFLVGSLFIGTLASPFIVSLVVIFASSAGFLIDVLVIEPAAWLIERPKLDLIVKLAGLIFLLTGFHFDLLAS